MIEKRCGNCQWFTPEPETEVDPQSLAAILAGLKPPLPSIAEGSTRPIYGKCRANFTDHEGNFQRFDMGMFSSQSCRAEDDRGNLLFTPKSELLNQ